MTHKRAIEERGPSQGHITSMDRGIMLAYSISLGKVKDTVEDTEDDASNSGRTDDRKSSGGSVTGRSA